jgi:hypothetical protein
MPAEPLDVAGKTVVVHEIANALLQGRWQAANWRDAEALARSLLHRLRAEHGVELVHVHP